MSVNNTTSKAIYSGDGGTVGFPFVGGSPSANILIYQSSDMVVQLIGIDGTVTDKTLNTDYTVALTAYGISGQSTATVTMVVAPASGETLVLTRVLPETQVVTEVDNEVTQSSVRNQVYDRAVMLIQQVQEQVDRSILQDPAASSAITLPSPVTGEALVWDAGGNLINSNLTGPQGPTGPAGPAGTGNGDVLGPATNTTNKVPQWSGTNNKTLKDGLAVGTAALNLVQLTAAAKLPAVDGSLLTGMATGNVTGPATNTDLKVPQWNGANSKILKDGLAVGTAANNLVQLDGSAKLPAVDGSQLTGIVASSLSTTLLHVTVPALTIINNSSSGVYGSSAYTTKVLKIAAVSTVTVYFISGGPTVSSGKTITWKVDIGGHTGTVTYTDSGDNPTPTSWRFLTVDVSALTNGTVYDFNIYTKVDASGAITNTLAQIIAFGS